MAFIKCLYNRKKIAFVSIYAPNKYENPFFSQVNKILAELSEYKLIIGTDMNTILHKKTGQIRWFMF